MIPGTLTGCIILGTLRNGQTSMNVQAFCQLPATRIIIIVAMLSDEATNGKQGQMMGGSPAVGPQARKRLPSLTPVEAGVTVDILARNDVKGAMPLRDISTGSGVSEAMGVKVSEKLDFAGFRKFDDGFGDHFSSKTAALHSGIAADDTAGEIIHKMLRTTMQALEKAYAILDLAFERAADFLHRAGQRGFFDHVGSDQIARDVAHRFPRIGIRALVFDDAQMMTSAALPGPDDVAIAFSHTGSTTAVLDVIALARRSGARTIAVTNHPDSAVARIARLNLLEALFVAVAQDDRQAADLNLSRTLRAVQSKRRS